MDKQNKGPTTLPFGHELPKRETVSKAFTLAESNAVESSLDLNQYLVSQPAATFFMRMGNNNMTSIGIAKGDILVVDRSKPVTDGKLIIAAVNNELMIKKFCKNGSQVELHSANPTCPPLLITSEIELIVWGVVSGVVRKL